MSGLWLAGSPRSGHSAASSANASGENCQTRKSSIALAKCSGDQKRMHSISIGRGAPRYMEWPTITTLWLASCIASKAFRS